MRDSLTIRINPSELQRIVQNFYEESKDYIAYIKQDYRDGFSEELGLTTSFYDSTKKVIKLCWKPEVKEDGIVANP